MYCLKCGKETTQEQVFCNSCLDSMAAYPVKPGTPVNLPKRPAVTAQKKPSRKKTSQEEVLALLRRWVIWLAVAVALLAILLSLTATALVRTGQALKEAQNTGKNFTVETTPENQTQ